MATLDSYTVTGPTDETWSVPNNVVEIRAKCYGAEGGEGTITNGDPVSGGNGQLLDAWIDVSNLSSVELFAGGYGDQGDGSGGFPDGGSGRTVNESGETQYSGGGGGSSFVARPGTNGTQLADVLLGAGGGGGGAGAALVDSSGSIGAGGNAPSGIGGDATGGGSTADGGFPGEHNFREGQNHKALTAANKGEIASGAGGGGFNGGGSGAVINITDWLLAGGGGAGRGLTDNTKSVNDNVFGAQSNDGQVTVEWYPKPTDPTGLAATINNDGTISLSWNDQAVIEDKYVLYESGTSDVLSGTSEEFGATTTSATVGPYEGSYTRYFGVRCFNGSTPSNLSNVIKVEAGVVKFWDGGSWVPRTLLHSGTTPSKSVKYYDGSTWRTN